MIPADLLTDLDVLALDATALDDFGPEWGINEKRRVAVTQWLRPRLESQGLPVNRHMTKREPSILLASTGGVVSDFTDAFGLRTDIDTDLSVLLATPGTDAIYVGMDAPYRGLFVAMGDSVNAAGCVASITYWNGRWSSMSSLVDETHQTGKSFSGGGRISWSLPDDWLTRGMAVTGANSSHAYYVRIQINSPLSLGTLVPQLLPLAFSRLTNPAALHALGLLYRESVGSNRASETWQRKAEMFLEAATKELELVLPFVKDEFDIDESGAVEETEVNSVVNVDYLTTWERG